jgi:antitoxin component YwqK of YwqJK toxin-antitoxin module
MCLRTGLVLVVLLTASGGMRPRTVHAQPLTCELNGQTVEPGHGSSSGTRGKSGFVRCRKAPDGPIQREEELRQGKYVGAVRLFKDGVLQWDCSVNEQGARDGRCREFAAHPSPSPAPAPSNDKTQVENTADAPANSADPADKDQDKNNPVIRDETFKEGKRVGLGRRFYESGQLRRIVAYGDDQREHAAAEYNEAGKLIDLRCSDQPLLAPDVDDAALCGFGPTRTPVELWRGNRLHERDVYERGRRVQSETMWPDGTLATQLQLNAETGIERHFSDDGVKLEEHQFLRKGKQRESTLHQYFYGNGQPQRELHYLDGRAVGEQEWFSSGQLRRTRELVRWNERAAFLETMYYESGTVKSRAYWLASEDSFGELPVGTHSHYDETGQMRAESQYDWRGQQLRQRGWDASGNLTQDDEVYDDGSKHSRLHASNEEF